MAFYLVLIKPNVINCKLQSSLFILQIQQCKNKNTNTKALQEELNKSAFN